MYAIRSYYEKFQQLAILLRGVPLHAFAIIGIMFSIEANLIPVVDAGGPLKGQLEYHS